LDPADEPCRGITQNHLGVGDSSIEIDFCRDGGAQSSCKAVVPFGFLLLPVRPLDPCLRPAPVRDTCVTRLFHAASQSTSCYLCAQMQELADMPPDLSAHVAAGCLSIAAVSWPAGGRRGLSQEGRQRREGGPRAPRRSALRAPRWLVEDQGKGLGIWG
jgi:hypothetical protein